MDRRVSIVGLGKVGACMAAFFASRKVNLIGVDINPALLEKVSVPVTVVWGGADRILPVPDGVDLQRVDAGHMLHMEAANDVLRHIQATVS